MKEGVVELKEILITSRPIDSNIKESLAGLTKMNIQEIKTLPTLMGEVDIVKSLQLMPGVTSVGEGSSGINVRGGRVDQNLVLLNLEPLQCQYQVAGNCKPEIIATESASYRHFKIFCLTLSCNLLRILTRVRSGFYSLH